MFRPRLLKLSLLVLFMFFFEWPQGAWQMMDFSSQRYSQEQARLGEVYKDYCQSLVNLANEKVAAGGAYTPVEYFTDLKLAHQKQEELGFKFSEASRSFFLRLNNLANNYLKKLTGEDLRLAKASLEEAREDYKELIDPARVARKKAREDLKSLGWQGAVKWLAWRYIEIIPFAFVLFLIWLSEDEDKKRQALFPRPGRFILMLLAYPAVIVWIFFKWLKTEGRNYLARAELLRTKERLFTSLSNEEIRRVREFSESALSLRSWRARLAALGMAPRHSLAAALAVTLLFAFVFGCSGASEKAKKSDFRSAVALEEVIEQYSARMSIGEEDGQFQRSGHNYDYPDREIVIESRAVDVMLGIGILRLQEVFLRVKEFCRQIDHVPLYPVIQFAVLSSKTH